MGGGQRWVKKKLTQQLDVCCIFLYVSLVMTEITGHPIGSGFLGLVWCLA